MAAKGSCLEEAGGPDSYYVDPDDAEGMADALNEILATGAEERRARARQYVTRFENTNVAQQIIGEYDRLMKE